MRDRFTSGWLEATGGATRRCTAPTVGKGWPKPRDRGARRLGRRIPGYTDARGGGGRDGEPGRSFMKTAEALQ